MTDYNYTPQDEEPQEVEETDELVGQDALEEAAKRFEEVTLEGPDVELELPEPPEPAEESDSGLPEKEAKIKQAIYRRAQQKRQARRRRMHGVQASRGLPETISIPEGPLGLPEAEGPQGASQGLLEAAALLKEAASDLKEAIAAIEPDSEEGPSRGPGKILMELSEQMADTNAEIEDVMGGVVEDLRESWHTFADLKRKLEQQRY